jgi:hypothetical protein
VVLPKGWSGLRDPELEAAFGRRLTTTETFTKCLGWYRSTPSLPSIQREDTVGDRTSLRVLTMLEKSLLDHAFPLATLFHAVRDAGGEGAFRLVNDGTSDGETGIELTLADGAIAKRQLEDDWDLIGQLGMELFAPSEEAQPKRDAKPTQPKDATRPKKTGPAEKAAPPERATKSAGGAMFARFIESEGLAWLSADRAIDDVMALIDGERRESSLGVLRYAHYRRSPATGAPVSGTDAAARLSLRARGGALNQVLLAIPADPNDPARHSEVELTQVGDGWKAAVTALAKRLGLKRVPQPGSGTAKQVFRGSVEGIGLELEWARSVSAVGGKASVGYMILLQRT